jgi:hypothetical protein
MQTNLVHIGAISFASLAVFACGGGQGEAGTELSNASTAQAQQALVKGAPRPAIRSRFRRNIEARSDFKALHPPYDLSDAPHAAMVKKQAAIVQQNTADSGWGPQSDDHVRFIRAERSGSEWEDEYTLDDLRALHEFARSRGINKPSFIPGAVDDKVGAPIAPGVSQQGWSQGRDHRIYKSLADYPATHNVLMRQGALDSGCTAALIGRRLVLTAAHCVITETGAASFPNYTARQDGATAPYGTYGTDLAWSDSRYNYYNCHITYNPSNRETCGKYDWALLRLVEYVDFPLWTGDTPGWMGYWLPATGGWFARLDGYPLCFFDDAPAGCLDGGVYGETSGHSTFNWRGVVNSEATVFNTANTMSSGHSGGPIVSSNYPDTNGPYVLGIVTNEMCGRCPASDPYSQNDKTWPTMANAMTSWVAGLITAARADYP